MLKRAPSLFLVSSVANSCLNIIISFSAVQSAHCPLAGVNGFACLRIFQLISNFFPSVGHPIHFGSPYLLWCNDILVSIVCNEPAVTIVYNTNDNNPGGGGYS